MKSIYKYVTFTIIICVVPLFLGAWTKFHPGCFDISDFTACKDISYLYQHSLNTGKEVCSFNITNSVTVKVYKHKDYSYSEDSVIEKSSINGIGFIVRKNVNSFDYVIPDVDNFWFIVIALPYNDREYGVSLVDMITRICSIEYYNSDSYQ